MGSTAPSERAPTAAVIEAVTGAAGAAPRKWQHVTGGGYTPAERWLIELDDGSRAFAKVATVGYTQEWLRTEHRAYLEIAGPFMPRLLGWSETPIPALLLEDLSGAHWPPPWDSEMVDRVRAALGDVSRAPCPAWAVPAAGMSDVFGGWSEIADDPEAFLELGMVSRGWLDAALPMLIAHERPPDLEGDALLHFDVRSDNICLAGERTLLVDWNLIARGNPLFDVAAWLPSLAHEGGPIPEAVCPEAGVFAAALAGYFCSRAPRATIAEAPHVRHLQREQARTALPWAARWLNLPVPDGRQLAGPS